MVVSPVISLGWGEKNRFQKARREFMKTLAGALVDVEDSKNEANNFKGGEKKTKGVTSAFREFLH